MDEKAESSTIREQFKKRISIALFVISSLIVFLWLLWPYYRLGFNSTPSLPGYVYLITIEGESYIPNKGDIVVFHPPSNDFYRDDIQFMKKVVGMPGDRVSYIGYLFYINEEYMGAAKKVSTDGREMELGPGGEIPFNHYFVWTPHENSYDSRYKDIGFVPRNTIFGRATRLL